jgi:phosphoenolpyruvate carboxykinase (GTP)
MSNVEQILKEKLSEKSYEKLSALENAKLHKFVADAIELTNPDSVFVCTDSEEDIQYIRDKALETGEEKNLKTKGHTVHFDGYHDQARDKSQTKYLVPKGSQLGGLNSTERDAGIEEVRGYLKDSMVGKEMLVCFFCLGPTDSDFSICSVQITDSPYVAHSESILYRGGYEQFRKIGGSEGFFRFLHTEGELENNVSKNTDKRRIYIDLQEDMVYSTNTQYAGNTVGLKKLALRLAIQKAAKEDWLAEHMFVLGAHGPNDRVTYFTGAFPSACGKTSTAMLPGQTIIGDDIAYLRKKQGKAFTANVEKGVFGIIRDVNADDDPVIFDALTRKCEVIFSNVLVKDAKPYWLGMGKELPKEGFNHSGEWYEGKKDDEGKAITPSHKNARYCLNISELSNRDPKADDPEGVPLGGVVYGGRDSDTWAPVEQAFNWREGIIAKGASIESETTAATLGQEGIRKFNIMSNMDFLSIPMGEYIQNNIDFGESLDVEPSIFSVNYFLKNEEGKFLNDIADKIVWIMWAERRVNNEVKARKTPTGYIPEYEDLVKLFREYRNKDYTKEDYEKQFTVRIPENLAKIDRIEKIYKEQGDGIPKSVFDAFEQIRQRYAELKEQKGEYVSPFDIPKD